MNVEIRENDILFYGDKETAQKLGAHYVEGSKFKLPKTLDTVQELLQIIRTPHLKELELKMQQAKDRLLQIKSLSDIEIPGLERLRPYQRVDVEFLSKLPHAGLYNEQRTGKTPTILSLFKYKDFKKIALVVPAGLALQWEKEVGIWLPGIKVIRIRGPLKQRERAYQSLSGLESFVLILSYDTLKQKDELKKITKVVKKFDALAIDEAHFIRSRTSIRTKAVKAFGKHAEHRYALTGTPAVRDGTDFFSILQFLYKDKFSSYWQFAAYYFELKEDYLSGAIQPTGKYIRQEALENMLAVMSTNRKRKEVMSWLPDKEYMTIPIELAPKQQKAYNEVAETFQYEEEGEMLVDASGVLAQMIRLRQICLAPSMLGINAPSAKEQFILEWLENNQEPVIIFSWFTSYLLELEKKLKEKAVLIHGKVSKAGKQQAIDDFQSGKCRILLANIEAANAGFTIDRAEVTIFLDKAWNPSTNAQASDRMIPISKERVHKTTVISLVASGTYDEKIDLLLQHKYNITEVINSGGLRALERIYKELNG